MTCPNCGHNSDYPRVCPNCGFVKSNPGNRAAAITVFILLVLPCAGMGACLILPVVASPNQEGQFYALMFGIPILLGLIGLLLWVRKLWRGK